MKALIGLTIGVCFLVHLCDCTAQEDIDAQVRGLMQNGDAAAAKLLLEGHLKEAPSDYNAISLLGKVLNYEGENTAALRKLHQGLEQQTTETGKIKLLLMIANIELQLGEDGPYREQARGMNVFLPGRDEKKEREFQAEHLAKSRQAFEAILEMKPEYIAARSQYYRALQLSNDHASAIKVLDKLVREFPAKPDFAIALASSYREVNDAAKAKSILNQNMVHWPTNAAALDMLADLYDESGAPETAVEFRKKSQFYSRVPEFPKLAYSAENVAKLDELEDAARVEVLLKDSSLESSKLLAIYCWWHPHNTLEDRAFEELGNRNDTLDLLEGLFDQANSSCTVRGAVRQLARQKSPAVFDRLVELLPRDLMSRGFEMDIATAFDLLGDPRAVEHLVTFLGSDPKLDQNGPPMMYSLPYAKARAIMALGAFDTPESRKALEELIADDKLGLCSVGALYRITKKKEYLDTLKKAVAEKDGGASYPVYRLSQLMPDDDEIKSLFEKLKEGRDGE
ncbi:MAG: hypothetical protein Q8M16_23335 [Pirellulaceae bacterium]|nr:hypothetical protein [Pirellulaceae bacterium]